MNIEPSTLPDNVDQLKAIIVDFQSHYEEKIADIQDHYEKKTGLLQEEIRLLKARQFGRKSEKIPSKDTGQLLLFDMPEPEDAGQAEEVIEVSAHARKKPGRKPLPEDLPRVEVVHDIPEEEKVCRCGCRLTRIGEEVSEQLDIIPQKMQVIRHIRPKYACRNCEGLKDDGPSVKIAPPEPQIIPKSIATPGLLAFIIVAKFVDALPFYRQEGQFARIGVDLSRGLMCKWAMKAAEACQPLLNLLQDEILDGPRINIDETTVQVLREPGRDPTTKSYMWAFCRAGPERPVLIYQYHPSRGSKVVSGFLGDFKGYVQTDGYQGYDFLDCSPRIRHIGCWAHARRKFMDVIKAQGKNRKKSGSADVALGYIRRLYDIERDAAKRELSSEDVYQVRQERSKPILEEFREWLLKKSIQTPPKGLLGKAILYTLKQWDRLIGYLEDGRLSPDNNFAENSIRPFVIGRKNWLFSGTPEGADASALLYSLIETAKANGLEPYGYLRHIFEKLPHAKTLEEYEALLPWNCAETYSSAARKGGVK